MTVMTEERREELENQRAAIKRNKRIPYEDLDRAKKIGEEAFPAAAEVRALLYQGAPYIEVWDKEPGRGGRAEIYFVDVDAGEVLPKLDRAPVVRRRSSRGARRTPPSATSTLSR